MSFFVTCDSELMDLNVFEVFQPIAVIILIDAYNVLPLAPENFFKLSPECLALAPMVLDVSLAVYITRSSTHLVHFLPQTQSQLFLRRNQCFLLVPWSGNACEDYNLNTRDIPWNRLGFHFWACSRCVFLTRQCILSSY